MYIYIKYIIYNIYIYIYIYIYICQSFKEVNLANIKNYLTLVGKVESLKSR